MNWSLSGSRESTALCYDSLNNSCARTVYPLSLRLSFYFILTTVVVLTVSGNLLVIAVILLCRNPLPAATNHLILSLSVAGLLIGGFVMPHSMVRSIETCWYFGRFFCEFHTTVDITLCDTTMWHLTFISIDRYLAVFNPLNYQNLMTTKTGAAMIISSCGVALMFAFAIVISNAEIENREDLYKSCIGGCFPLHARQIGVEYSIIFYFIPVSIILTVYFRIYFVAKRHVRAIHNYNKGKNCSISLTAKQFKASKTLSIVVGTFLLCWTPFFVCNIIKPLKGHSINTLLYESLMWVAYINATINPFIYMFFYSWFRKSANVLLCKLFHQM